MNAIIHQPQAWALILGVVTPILVSIVNQPTWSTRTRSLVSVACAVAVGLLTVLAKDKVNTQSILTTVALVMVASQSAYASLFKPTGLAKVIELKTSPGRQPEYEPRHRAEDESTGQAA